VLGPWAEFARKRREAAVLLVERMIAVGS
jgi:hypothetical protein